MLRMFGDRLKVAVLKVEYSSVNRQNSVPNIKHQSFNHLWLGSFYAKKEPWFHYELMAVTKWNGTAHSADRMRLILVYVVGVHRSNSHKPKDSRDLMCEIGQPSGAVLGNVGSCLFIP